MKKTRILEREERERRANVHFLRGAYNVTKTSKTNETRLVTSNLCSYRI